MRLDRQLAGLVLLLAAVATPALAQTQTTLTQYPECTAKPTTEDSDAARNAYLFGKRKYDEAEYATAVNYFKDAYKTDCTKHEILIIISRSYELAGNKAEAINALETYLKRNPTAADAAVQQKRIANLKASNPTPPPSASSSSSSSAQPLPLPPPPTSSATAPPAASSAPPPSKPPPAQTSPSSEPRSNIVPWIVTGAGVAVLGTGVVLFIVGNGKVGTANDGFRSLSCNVDTHSCPKNPTPGLNLTPSQYQARIDQYNSDLSSATTTRTIGIVGMGLGGALVAGGLVWHFVFDKKKPADSNPPAAAITPIVGPGYGGLSGVF